MRYRQEIDGLRAVAVVPVVLFHAGFDVFSGGFVGVDIFFVISGYLITTILITDLDAGTFSIVSFYERRARRILPALFFVMLCCLPFAWLWMSPAQLVDFSQSLIAVGAFASNILFLTETGYFNAASELKPLLHTWSLAVEEQFYIFFPFLLLVLWRFSRRNALGTIILLSIMSLLMSHWGAIEHPSATFYLIPTRAWELGVGCVCAFLLTDRQPYEGTLQPLIGLALIFGSIFVFDVSTPFPSFWALAPVGGTALVILFAHSSSLTAKILSARPIVFLGIISYSAYLWHQPLFAFVRLQSRFAPSMLTMFCLAVLSFGLAVLSWHYIEQPFRRKEIPFPNTRRQVFGFSLCAIMLFAGIGQIGNLIDGAPFRKTPSGLSWQELALDDRLAINPGMSFQCVKGSSFENVLANPDCRTGETPRVLLWGDSYAMHLAGALKASTMSKSYDFIQLAKSQCAPIIDRGINGSVITAKECIFFNDRVMTYLRGAKDIEVVIMSSPYAMLGKRPTFDRSGKRQDTVNENYDHDQMVNTAELIISMGKVPVFVSPTPTNGVDIGQCLGRALALQAPLSTCNYSRNDILSDRLRTFEVLGRLKNNYTVIDLRDTLCPDSVCVTATEGVFLYRDTGHLSIEGSSFIGRKMDPFHGLLEEQIIRDLHP